MPLVRAQVRNEYGLGMPELYKDADKEDPKALLDGVAVAGLVGILRQLGDLAEFAAEVFHGLQEQVMNTSSRSNKLMVRAQIIEAAYSPLEKTLLAQRSHLHFAYTSGSHWKAHIQSEQNHFIHSDLPLFIMDSYEECRGPPRLHLLDKFDTGGPGSCLKRYSDPTFFKRASAGFEEAYAENFPRDKKARRRKKMNQKKRTWIQNGDKPQLASHGLSDRMHYASQNFGGQTSPSQTVSTYDAASKLEMEDHSNSFGSKTASGYGECVSSPIYNIKFDGCEPDEISSQLTMNVSDTLDTSSLEEQRGILDNDVEEQTGPRSSCVTWDEKTEIMEPIGPQNHSEETMEVHTNLSLDSLEGESANIKSDYCSNGSMPKSVCGANQLDDNESETDNYMDALNTIESESETDLECQTKGKLKQSSNNIAADRSIDRLNLLFMNITSSNIDSPIHVSTNVAISEENHNPISIQTNCISSEETIISKPSSVTSECYAKVQSPHDTGKSSPMESLPLSDLITSDDITSPNTEAVDRNLGSLDSTITIEQPSKPDTVLSSPSKSQKSPSVASGVTGINFWTNGVLLGLQPSKPSDFSTLDSVNHESMVPSSQSDILEGEESASKPNILRNSKLSKQDCSSKCTTSSHHDEEDIISIMKTSLRSSQAHSDRIPELTTNLHHSFSSNQSHNLLFPEASTMVHGTEKRDNPDARTFIEQFGSESPFISPSSSPPLEHMKISFQPINGVDISKLKLKFPDGNEGHECSVDVFSSFQLVPEESTSFQDVGSDSDGDTFCESSPHGSEDCLSHYSESDSEEWETRESPRCNDNDIYDALWGNSAESVSSNLDVGRITQGVITNKSGIQNLFTDTVMEHSQTDLPNFDILNGSFRKDLHSDSETKHQLDSDCCNEPTPPPPPLPPMEWRGMKPNPDVGIVQQVPSIQALEHDFYKKLSTSTISQPPKPAPVKHDNTEAIACTTNSKHPNVKKDADQSFKSKVVDEKEDFLQQIRTKSFSLRRTTTERPNLASSAPANVSVTAILEKANAIRQAVGSDEGEDDDSCWSEDL